MSYTQDVFTRQGREVSVYRNVETGRFASEEDVITYIFLWHSMGDACPKCLSLNGQQWEDQSIYQEVLWDPIWGDIYDLNGAMPMTHPNCRCTVEVRTFMDLRQMDELTEFNGYLDLLGI